jgi:MoxR-like ATPase
MIDPFLTAALAALDAWLVEVCDREEARAQRLAQGGLTGWAGVKALARPAAAELAFDADAPPDLVPEGDQPLTAGREAFRLEPAETEALLVLLSLHLEPRYGALYGVLQGSTHAWATERLLLTVLGRRMDRRRALLESLSDAGRLLGAGLVVVVEGSSHAPLCRPLDLAPEVRSALLGIGLPSRLGAATLERLDGRDRGAPLGPAPAACSVVFGAGEWRPSVEALAGARRDLLLVGPVDDRAAVLSAGLAAWRLGALTGALPVVDLTGIDSAAAAAVASALRRRVEAYGGRIALRARDPLPLPVPHVEARVPPFSERRRVWRDEAARHGASLSEEEAGRLAATFRAGPAGVRDAFGAAVEVGAAGLREAAARLARVPVRHAQEVEVRRTFADLVVRDTTREALERLVHFATHKDRLDEERGLSTRFRMRRGPLVLFSGLSGTGKTLAAEAVAHALGRALHVVDLSRLVSKYIGETEKHISEVLSDAERAGVVLFFDEADALFSTRTEVSTSNDRYANLEVGFLLQRIEQHDGVTILATNLRQAIDEAFLRRFQFRVEFPLPEPAERRGIWDRMIPPGVPRAPGLDLEALGRAHRLAGGDIANAALRAIFLAERGGEPVENHHLERAVALELMELGRLSRRVPPRDDDPRDAGMLLKLFVEALSSLLEEHLRRRFIKEIHLVHGAPTKEALAGRRPAVSVALYRMSAPRAGGLRLGIIVSAWSHKAEEEHELLGAAHEALMGKLPGLLGGAKAVMRVQESNDFDLLHRFWSSHGHPVRASVVVEGEIG